MSVRVINMDCRAALRGMVDDESIDCCVTSPPYWGLRDYGFDGQIGLEPTPDEYVSEIVDVFREVRRVLKPEGTLWLNLGDTYFNGDKWGGGGANTGKHTRKPDGTIASWDAVRRKWGKVDGLKPKDLIGVPWRVAFALQADGWYLRSDIVWHKPNPMPESVRDRPTKAHEYVFLMSKSPRYWYDAEAIKTEAKYPKGPNSPGSIKSPHGQGFTRRSDKPRGHVRRHAGFNDRWDAMTRKEQMGKKANARSVWKIATRPYPEAHFATFPEELARRCILAGCPDGGTVLDPFAGSGTTGQVASENGRDALLVEANPEYCRLIEKRCAQAHIEMRGAA